MGCILALPGQYNVMICAAAAMQAVATITVPTCCRYSAEMLDQRKKKKKNGTEAKVTFPVDDELNRKVSLWKGNITTLEIDCIVNAANCSLLGGGGGMWF